MFPSVAPGTGRLVRPNISVHRPSWERVDSRDEQFETMTTNDHTAAGGPVEWTRRPASRTADPVRLRRPYLEVVLEHPDLPATRVGKRFFPSAVPYRHGVHRVFYWRRELPRGAAVPESPAAVVATTDGIAAVPDLPADVPPVTASTEGGRDVVVDGTVGGDAKRTVVEDYDPPPVVLRSVGDEAATLSVGSRSVRIPAGERREVALPQQTVTVRETPEGAGPETRRGVVPRLVVRFPGVRTLYHPATEADYLLFPSFGVDLSTTPNPLPLDAGDPAPETVADALGVDLDDRPYPERVLWEAFVHAAFDPRRSGPPELTQFPDGLLAVHGTGALAP